MRTVRILTAAGLLLVVAHITFVLTFWITTGCPPGLHPC